MRGVSGRCNAERSAGGRSVRKQTGVVDILVDIDRKTWTWPGHVMHRTDNWWSFRAMEWLPRKGKHG